MAAVVKLFWGICLLRQGPEHVPTHTWFIAALVAAQLALAVVAQSYLLPTVPVSLALNMALIGLAVSAGIAWFALYVRGFEARFPATLGAMLGAGLVIDAVLLVGYAATSGVVREIAYWTCLAWSIVVVGFILHRALACKLWLGGLLSFGMSFAGLVVIQAALGTALAASLA